MSMQNKFLKSKKLENWDNNQLSGFKKPSQNPVNPFKYKRYLTLKPFKMGANLNFSHLFCIGLNGGLTIKCIAFFMLAFHQFLATPT
jgi:hypothetical protein